MPVIHKSIWQPHTPPHHPPSHSVTGYYIITWVSGVLLAHIYYAWKTSNAVLDYGGKLPVLSNLELGPNWYIYGDITVQIHSLWCLFKAGFTLTPDELQLKPLILSYSCRWHKRSAAETVMPKKCFIWWPLEVLGWHTRTKSLELKFDCRVL